MGKTKCASNNLNNIQDKFDMEEMIGSGYDFDLAFSYFDNDSDQDTDNETLSTISYLLNKSKNNRINNINNTESENASNKTNELSLIENEEEVSEIIDLDDQEQTQESQIFNEKVILSPFKKSEPTFWERFKHIIIASMIILIIIATLIAGYMFFSKEINNKKEFSLTPLTLIEQSENLLSNYIDV